MSNYDQIYSRLSALIAEKTKLTESDISPELNLEASGLDSFARIELILVVETEFDMELTDAESANVATVDDIVKIIELKSA